MALVVLCLALGTLASSASVPVLVRSWSVDQVCRHFYAHHADLQFTKQIRLRQVDGHALCSQTFLSEQLVDFGLVYGVRARYETEIGALCNSQPAVSSFSYLTSRLKEIALTPGLIAKLGAVLSALLAMLAKMRVAISWCKACTRRSPLPPSSPSAPTPSSPSPAPSSPPAPSTSQQEQQQPPEENKGHALRSELAGEARYQLGLIYLSGGREDKIMAIKCFAEASLHDHRLAQHKLHECYSTNVGVSNLEEAKEVDWKATENENRAAQFLLGLRYEHGRGVAQNHKQAVEWYTKAAVHEHEASQWALGCCYTHGIGVALDTEKGFDWYTRAAKHGDVFAQTNLAHYYREIFLSKTAVEWLTKAAVQEHADAEFHLAFYYFDGRGVAEDRLKAIELTTKAAVRGHAVAQYMLGRLCQIGSPSLKVNKDITKAVEWYTKAAVTVQGHGVAITCPSGHGLISFATLKPTFSCGFCKQLFPVGTQLHGCHQFLEGNASCNFFCCPACLAKKMISTRNRKLEKLREGHFN